MKTTDFPSLEKAATSKGMRYPQHYINAISYIDEGMIKGEIYNARLSDAKHTLSSLIYDAWSKQIRPYRDQSDRRTWPDDIVKFFDNLSIMGLNDIIHLNNRLKRLKTSREDIEVIRGFVTEILPLSMAVADMKDKVIKGRMPSTGPSKPVNPNKDVQTCPCCFQPFAVRKGKMVHHGYQRPGDGQQTASCYGIEFAPLEIAKDGVIFMIDHFSGMLDREKAYLDRLATADEVRITTGFMKFETVRRGDRNWERSLEMARHKAQTDVDMLSGELRLFQTTLDIWEPGKAHVASRMDIRAAAEL